jgi:hypothetical protein
MNVCGGETNNVCGGWDFSQIKNNKRQMKFDEGKVNNHVEVYDRICGNKRIKQNKQFTLLSSPFRVPSRQSHHETPSYQIHQYHREENDVDHHYCHTPPAASGRVSINDNKRYFRSLEIDSAQRASSWQQINKQQQPK